MRKTPKIVRVNIRNYSPEKDTCRFDHDPKDIHATSNGNFMESLLQYLSGQKTCVFPPYKITSKSVLK